MGDLVVVERVSGVEADCHGLIDDAHVPQGTLQRCEMTAKRELTKLRLACASHRIELRSAMDEVRTLLKLPLAWPMVFGKIQECLQASIIVREKAVKLVDDFVMLHDAT